MDPIRLTSNSSQLVIDHTIVANSIDVNQINVSDDFYINNNIYLPVGSIITYAGTTSPGGWLLCDGSEVSKTSYPRLFSVIGTLYGTSINTNNFVLPNLADRVSVGKSATSPVGSLGGNNSIILSTNQLPAHTHTGTTVTNGNHAHIGTTNVGGGHTHVITDPGHTHTQTTTNDDYNNSGTNPPGFSADSAGTQVWSNINTAYTGISINNSGDHTHGFITDNSGSHTHTFTSDSTGIGSAINIRNRYIMLNYIIRV